MFTNHHPATFYKFFGELLTLTLNGHTIYHRLHGEEEGKLVLPVHFIDAKIGHYAVWWTTGFFAENQKTF